MKLKQLNYLVNLKKFGSFSKASRELYISQPSMSLAIKELEDELGFAILTRNNKGVDFTHLGKLVVAKAERIIEETEQIARLGKLVGGNLYDQVTVGASPFLFRLVMLKILMLLQEDFPDLVLRLRECDVLTTIDLLQKGELDLGIIMIYNTDAAYIEGELKKYDLRFHEMQSLPVYFFVRQGHPLDRGYPAALSEIVQYPYALSGDLSHSLKADFLKKYGYKGEFVHINSYIGVRDYILGTDAMISAPAITVFDKDFTAQGKLRPVEITDFFWQCRIGWVHQNEPLSLGEQKIIYCINHELKQLIAQLQM